MKKLKIFIRSLLLIGMVIFLSFCIKEPEPPVILTCTTFKYDGREYEEREYTATSGIFSLNVEYPDYQTSFHIVFTDGCITSVTVSG
jgi:hypothetical protein